MSAEYDSGSAEAELSEDVEDGVDGATDVAGGVAGDDHCSEACLGAEGCDEGGSDCAEEAEAEDGSDSVGEGEGEGVLAEDADGDGGEDCVDGPGWWLVSTRARRMDRGTYHHINRLQRDEHTRMRTR